MSLTIAIPSKGRLKEKSIACLIDAGFDLKLPEDVRSYQGTLFGIEGAPTGIDVSFLSASEIARELIRGTVNVGITGEDLARETIADVDAYLEFSNKLGFGHANVVLCGVANPLLSSVGSLEGSYGVQLPANDYVSRCGFISTNYFWFPPELFTDYSFTLYRFCLDLHGKALWRLSTCRWRSCAECSDLCRI